MAQPYKPEVDARPHIVSLIYPSLPASVPGFRGPCKCKPPLLAATNDEAIDNKDVSEWRSPNNEFGICQRCNLECPKYVQESLPPSDSFSESGQTKPKTISNLQSAQKSPEAGNGASNICRNSWLYIGIGSLVLGLVVLVVGLVVAGLFKHGEDLPTTMDIYDIVHQRFQNNLPGIEKIFAKQSYATWSTIRTAVRMTTMPKSRNRTSPGVISLIPSDTETAAEDTVNCLARQLALTLQTSYDDKDLLQIDGKKLNEQWSDAGELGEYLDRLIRQNLEQNVTHVVLISNLDQLPGKSGMLLHGLCDNDNAPFKQAIYILTVSNRNRHPAVENDSSRPAALNLVDAQVTVAWKSELTEEKRQSLETRIGNHIAIVLPETKETLERVC